VVDYDYEENKPAPSVEGAIEAALVRIGSYLLRALYAALALAVIVTAGAAAWVTETNIKLSMVIDEVQALNHNVEKFHEEVAPLRYLIQDIKEIKSQDARLHEKFERHINDKER
jgi:hypothetical protein